jgi:hypothetical protein
MFIFSHAPSQVSLNAEQYAKRLVANSSSIPVLDIVVSELQSKFAFEEYPSFAYEFRWLQSPLDSEE